MRISPNALLLLAWIGSVLYPAQAMASDELPARWSGLQQDGRQLNRVTLEIGAAASDSQGDAGTSRQRTRNQAAPVFSALQFGSGQPRRGRISFEPARLEPLQAAAPGLEVDWEGEWFPELNLLKLRYLVPRKGRSIAYGVFDRKRRHMALVYGGPGGPDQLPIPLAAGSEPAHRWRAFATPRSRLDETRGQMEQAAQNQATQQQNYQLELQQLQAEMQQARAARDRDAIDAVNQKILALSQTTMEKMRAQMAPAQEMARQQIEQRQQQQQRLMAATAELNTQAIALQREMAEALQQNDHQKAQRIQGELQALAQQRIAAMSGRSMTPPAAAGAADVCTGQLFPWAAALEAHGASAAGFSGMVTVANLFRPSVFDAHFEEDLIGMAPETRRELAFQLEQRCTREPGDFARGGNITSVAQAFGEDGHQINYISAAMAGDALDRVAAWLDKTLTGLVAAGSSEALDQLMIQSEFLLAALWPDEARAGREQIALGVSKAAGAGLLARIDSLGAAIDAGDGEALVKLGRLRYLPDWNKMDAAERARIDKRYDAAASRHLAKKLGASYPAAADEGGKPQRALKAGKSWYDTNSLLLSLFADTSAVREIEQRLLRSREAHYQKLFKRYRDKIGKLDDKRLVENFGDDFALPLDETGSKTWVALNEVRAQRLIELDRVAFEARVGSGPFQPDDAGAIYLNALYRGDWDRIAEEDGLFVEPIIAMMAPLNSSGIYELFAAFSGGSVSADDLRQRMRDDMRNSSMSDSLAGFFVVSYEHLAPACLGQDHVEFEKTVTWDEVVENGMGLELSRFSHSETYHYRIARRHADAFRKLGDATSAEQLDMVGGMLGGLGLIPPEARRSMRRLAANLRGLREAMQKHACDGEVMKKLEASLLARALRRG